MLMSLNSSFAHHDAVDGVAAEDDYSLGGSLCLAVGIACGFLAIKKALNVTVQAWVALPGQLQAVTYANAARCLSGLGGDEKRRNPIA
jgi:hypothetical protein